MSQCHRPGPITPNPFFNFLRWFRQRNCGKTMVQIAVEGSKKWHSMSIDEKKRFYDEAKTARPYNGYNETRKRDRYTTREQESYFEENNISEGSNPWEICPNPGTEECHNWHTLATFLFIISLICFIFEEVNR